MCACIDEKKSIVCSVSYVRVRVPPPGGHCKVIIVLLNSRFRMLVYIYTHTHTHAHTHTHTHTHTIISFLHYTIARISCIINF